MDDYLSKTAQQQILDKMTDHKVSDFVAKKSYHDVTLVSKYPTKDTSDTVSVDPRLLFQKLITVGYRNSSSTAWKVYCVRQKKYKYHQPKFCLMATKVVLQKTIFIWKGRNHMAITYYSKVAT